MRALWEIFRDFWIACWEVIKLPFFLMGLGWRRFFGLGFRKVLYLVIAAMIVTIVASVLFIRATSQPGFCVSCHVMQPYFDAWRTSKHHNINCTTCHVPPGIEGTLKHKFQALSMVANYVTGLYKRSRPWAEIDDAACLRDGCHETRLLNGKVNFKGVTFDHQPHLTQTRRERQLRCTSCHAQIVQGEHISVTEGTCFLCHFRPDQDGKPTELSRCTHCHTPPTGPAAADTAFDHSGVLARGVDCTDCHTAAVSGNGYVPPERCSSCHAKAEHIQRYKDMEFVHRKHVTEHKVECLQCHVVIRHGKAVAEDKDPALKCIACHGNAQALVWNGTLPGLPPTPTKMSKVGMTCLSCHVEPIHHTDKSFSKPRCSPCHEDRFDALWPKWKAPLQNALVDIEPKIRALPAAQRDSLLAALQLYRAANPVHNPDLITQFAKRVETRAHAAGNCTACHPAAADAAPLHNGKPVPHSAHSAANIECTTCHEAADEHHGRLKLSDAQCNACHHRTAQAANCATCHIFQSAIYSGKADVPLAEASAMSAASVACAECHAVSSSGVTRRDPEACTRCHDATSYADTLQMWQAQGDSLFVWCERMLKTQGQTTQAVKQFAQLSATLRRDGSRTAHNPALFIRWGESLRANR
jgi:nitrate/TMAO reductase-like tetraheme cytochrome c subunit